MTRRKPSMPESRSPCWQNQVNTSFDDFFDRTHNKVPLVAYESRYSLIDLLHERTNPLSFCIPSRTGPYLARFKTSRAVPDPSDVVAVVHFSSSPEIVKERF